MRHRWSRRQVPLDGQHELVEVEGLRDEPGPRQVGGAEERAVFELRANHDARIKLRRLYPTPIFAD